MLTPELLQLTDDLYLHLGAINVGIVRQGDRALLIDCTDGLTSSLERLGIRRVDTVLFTHHHRDQAAGLGNVVDPAAGGTRLVAPALERVWFTEVSRYWDDPARRWHVYDFHPHHLMLTEPVPITDTCQEPDQFAWGPAQIRVLDAPGHTDGSVSYEVALSGKRFIFCGDAIYDAGQIWDVYSLQKGGTPGGHSIRDYHGFMGAGPALAASLRKVKEAVPHALVPSHGHVMTRPAEAIDALRANLEACYTQYAAISAIRYYMPKLLDDVADKSAFMPFGESRPVPSYVRHIETTWVVIAADGAALVMDCGSRRVIDELKKMHERGEIRCVDALWISHYHDDHVDALPEFQRTFPCSTFAAGLVADVVTQPAVHRLPCLSPAVARVDRRTGHGESWAWREFKLTAYDFPGQTLYHGALLVEGRGQRLFFIGDSFTPSGIDDYCAGNRNLLGAGRGFDACLSLVDELQPDALFNCHVDTGFSFSPEQIRTMRANLAEREALFGRLLPWDHPNYGLDEHWVRCDPYEQEAAPGETIRISVAATNHSAVEREVACRPLLPTGWGPVAARIAPVAAGADGGVEFTIRIPTAARPGRYVIPIEVRYGRLELGPFREAIIAVV